MESTLVLLPPFFVEKNELAVYDGTAILLHRPRLYPSHYPTFSIIHTTITAVMIRFSFRDSWVSVVSESLY